MEEVQKPITQKEKKHLFKMTLENDIKFRGPFTYQIVRIIGWVCMALGMIAGVISAATALWPSEFGHGVTVIQNVLDVFGLLPTSLFLLANFGIILLHRNNFKKLLITYISFTLVFIVVFIFVSQHYLVQSVMAVARVDYHEANIQVSKFLASSTISGISFNVFADILVCVLIFFFLNYTPKKYFQDKKIIIFRLLTIIPVLYEIASFLVKAGAQAGYYVLPTILFPFLTSKPILMTLSFLAIALALKVREIIFIKKGYSKDQYMEYRLTNRNSFQVSAIVSIVFVITALIDLTIALIMFYSLDGTTAESTLAITGAGKCVGMFFLTPIIMLYCLTKEPKKPSWNIYITLGGVILVAFTIFEGYYQIALHALTKS